MRTTLGTRIVALAAVAALGVACGGAQAEERRIAPAGRPVAVGALQAVDGTVAVGGRVLGTGRLDADGTVAVVADATDGQTLVRWVATADGTTVATVAVGGELELAAVDQSAHHAALVTPGRAVGGGAIATARPATEVVVVDRSSERFRGSYPGNLVPEGFANWFDPSSTLPGAAFLLEYTPPSAPTHYRVRVLDLASGQLGLPLNLRDKTQTVDQEMAGVSRTQLLAADDGLLFTLYRGHHDEGHGSYAFVHTLGLGNGVWCLVVPEQMQLADRPGALVLDPSQRHLVAVSANGTVASIPIDRITDGRVAPDFDAPVDLGVQSAHAPAVATGRDVVWIGMGRTLLRVDPDTSEVQASFAVPMELEAVAELGDGSVTVGGEGRLLTLTPTGTVTAESATPDGLGPLHRIV